MRTTSERKASKAAWDAAQAKRHNRMQRINGTGWNTNDGRLFVAPYAGDQVEIFQGVDRFGWSTGPAVITVSTPDADANAIERAATVSEAPAMIAILRRVVSELTETDLDADRLLEEAQALISRIAAKSAAIERLADEDFEASKAGR